MSLTSRVTDLAAAIRDKLNLMTPRLLPSGGNSGETLVKSSANDYEVVWSANAGGFSGSFTCTMLTNRFEHTETFSVIGMTDSHKPFVTLAATTNEDENEPSMLNIVSMQAIPLTDAITFEIVFGEQTRGPIKLNYGVH